MNFHIRFSGQDSSEIWFKEYFATYYTFYVLYALVRTQFGWTTFSDVMLVTRINLLISMMSRLQFTLINVHTTTLLILISINCLYRKLTSCRFKLMVHCSQHTKKCNDTVCSIMLTFKQLLNCLVQYLVYHIILKYWLSLTSCMMWYHTVQHLHMPVRI